jgi:diadenosine tetraphosphatase ApaH/serine/threonine PP2A family protein phosphatase
VSDKTRQRLAALPFRIDAIPEAAHTSGPRAILVHGTPTLNTLYWDIDRSDAFCRKMIRAAGVRKGDLIACGHTHVPWQRVVDGVHLFNAGSVGRPKDGDPRACYGLVSLDASGPDAELIRVTYDVERARQGIQESGLPSELAEALTTGSATPSPQA